jgi:hypothetical protein
VKNIMVTHAFANPEGSTTIDEATQAAEIRACVELVYDMFDNAALDHITTRSTPSAPRILFHPVTSGSQAGFSIPVAEIHPMGKINPAKLLGLQP